MAAELPSEIMPNILSRLPVKSLARFRCVSKQWCNHINDSYLQTMHAPIMFHQSPSYCPNAPCRLSFLEYKEEEEAGSYTVKKEPPVMEFMCKSNWSYGYPDDDMVLGSCNGLLYSSKAHRDGDTLLFVIDPLRIERYELPPIKTPFHPRQQQSSHGFDIQESNGLGVLEESRGLGFDDSTNTFKMVCVMLIKEQNVDLCTMVHVLGTDWWRNIPQIPSLPISGEGVFANGCLHWLCSEKYSVVNSGRPVITFDMAKEEFGFIHPPYQEELPPGSVEEQFLDLHGEVGYVYHIVNRKIIKLWVLKERGWVMHCEFKQKPPLPSGYVKVLGFLNDYGDILVTDNSKTGHMFVYKFKSDSLHEVSFVRCREEGLTLIQMYQSSLASTRYSIKILPRKLVPVKLLTNS